MFIEERHEAILRTLHEHGKVKVRDLSEKFQVTDDCIRKDLKVLENAGCLKRTYGGAILSQDYPLERDVVDRRNVNVEKKAAIAEKALGLIRDNETIFLDISTTNIKLAELLVEKHRRVVVVSNMIIKRNRFGHKFPALKRNFRGFARQFFLFFVKLKKRLFFKVKHLGKNIGWKRFYLGIHGHDRRVVKTARGLNLVFGIAQLLL